ncbi:GlcG/HbpS family heme-binding protein [Nevskia soli]|uniref:GlcG/HbpS family heme-binding protein n=1 Tax=Nevskia soli TaxID=418856 RepID=UPI0004A6B3F3|nr:heme-binding protein [Nevskia soli]
MDKISTQQRIVNWSGAHAALGAAARAADDAGLLVNIAVVDRGGVLAGFVRMAGAPLHSVEIAIDKAYTAASFGMATSCWSEVLRGHSDAVRDGLVRRPRFVAFGGGLPIRLRDDVIGGIGVSGASEEQDAMIARAGLDAIGAVE